MSESSCYTKPETGGEGSSGKPMNPSNLDNGIDLNQPSSGEVEHDEKGDKRSDKVDKIEFGLIDSPQSDMFSDKDGNMTQTECHISEDPFHDAIKAYLDQSGHQWVYLDTTNNTIVVCWVRIPDEAEDLKREIRLLMGDMVRLIRFVETVPPANMTWDAYWRTTERAVLPHVGYSREDRIPIPCDVCRRLAREEASSFW
ncbi:hypothetical protein CEP54_002129 [Fusarium duplospermum]|uniref:Uncharacterized protein n=1 Tax=Fusarium duplospermum TaxID=1325734 RepID=A0A428QWZ3_9HYPO|nr:hypothetical protein CEP54_002129 [Fusarium duplospermum]